MSRVIDICQIEVSLAYSHEQLILFLQKTIAFIGDSFPSGDLSIAFMSDSRLAEIHREFMDDPSVTDVITFPSEDPDLAGEICISADMAVRQSKEHQTDFAEELCLYLIHGCLHLAGYEDIAEEDIRLMREAERDIIEHHRRSDSFPKITYTP